MMNLPVSILISLPGICFTLYIWDTSQQVSIEMV